MSKVRIFSTPTCSYCRLTKQFFTEHNVAYEEHDVASDLSARQEMLTKSGQSGVPVIFVDDQVVVGYDRERLSELLGIEA